MSNDITLDDLEFEGGALVKIRGARPEYMDGHRLIDMVRQIARLAANQSKMKTTMPIDALVDQAIIRGRIEAFEFIAKQLQTYASDIDDVIERGYYKGKTKLVEAGRRDEQRKIANECYGYIFDQKKDLLLAL